MLPLEWALFIDDERMPNDFRALNKTVPIVIARTYYDAKRLLEESFKKNHPPKWISFDHDLGDKDGDGKDLANLTVELILNHSLFSSSDREKYHEKALIAIYNGALVPKVWSHSMNVVGKANIDGLFRNFDKTISSETEDWPAGDFISRDACGWSPIQPKR